MKGPEAGPVKTGEAGAANATPSASGAVLLGGVRFFQEWISPVDGSRCGFSPTCSQYGYRALRDHGALFGLVLTADRLMRCNIWTEAGRDYQRLPSGKLYDPVVSNLFTQP
jgi:putative membrane protein insertion efficiency factor